MHDGEEAVAAPRLRVDVDSLWLTLGTAVNGLLAYAFFALVTRGLGADDAAPVAVLWTYWGACTAFITFPVQHWMIRTVEADGEPAVGAGLRRLCVPVAAFALLATGVSVLAGSRLFTVGGLAFPSLVGVVTLGTFVTGIVRGGLSARGEFRSAALALAADNAVRVIGAIGVLSAGGGSAGVGAALASGALVGLAWPRAFRFPSTTASVRPERLVGPVAAGSALAQFVLVGGPVLVGVLGGGPQDVTTLFVTLALFRAPYLVTLGLSNQATGPLTAWTVEGRRDLLRRFLRWTGAVTTLGASAAAGFGALVGPAAVALVFGPGVRPESSVAAVVAAGSVVAVGALVLSLAVIGDARGARLAVAWCTAVSAAGVVLVVVPAQPMMAAASAFLAGELVGMVALLAAAGTAARDGVPARGRRATRAAGGA